MKNVLLILTLLSLVACSKTPCADPTSVASLATGQLATLGSCNAAGAAAIQTDVTKVAATLTLCVNTPTGLFASALCGPLIDGLLSLASSGLNARYAGCNFTLPSSAAAALVSACGTLPF